MRSQLKVKRLPKRKYKHSGIAPLVEVDPMELTDQRLNPEEAVIRQREELLALESKKKIWGQDELEDAERSSGARMNYTEVIRRLYRCNLQLRVVDGSAGAVSIYVKKRKWEYTPDDFLSPEECAIMNIPRPKNEFFIDHRYVSGMLKTELPEWSHVTVDTSHIAHREVRGWRSVVIACIKSKAITYEQAVREFGDPVGDRRSRRWIDQVYRFKKQ